MLVLLLLPCLLQGLLPNLIKLAPAAGISWYVFEETKMLMGVDPRS
jgi:solute carrier family 25 phosphate transporter 23/24/25/41